MRLIHTSKLYLQEFIDDPATLKYAVLSHRWGRDEVTFQNFQSCLGSPNHGEGMSKILRCSQLASSRGISWLWVDTCCIDKTNSVELSEALNSMWRWYRLAVECYVYLIDIRSMSFRPLRPGEALWYSGTMSQESFEEFKNSSWFSRGWTLQELLAPRNMLFCDAHWKAFGTKDELAPELSWITGIRQRYLRGIESVSSASIAMRMSWASKRETTKREDIAYCLLGLFDVNMPMLYGEGTKAFMRLQLEIIKKSSDESIFAWRRTSTRSAGMLAASPQDFSESGHIVHFRPGIQRLPFSMTNQGLELRLPASSASVPDAQKANREYLTVGFQMPNIIRPSDDRLKEFSLNCGSTEAAPTGCTPEEIIRCAKDNVVFISLALVESTWQRIHCHKLDIRKGAFSAEIDPAQSTYSLYYIYQQGL